MRAAVMPLEAWGSWMIWRVGGAFGFSLRESAVLVAMTAHLFIKPGDVLGRGAAAAADRIDAPAREFADHLAEGLWQHGIDGFAIDIDRQAGVGQDADGEGRALDEVLNGRAHVFWSGGAIQTQQVNRQRRQRGQGAGDIGAEEHAPADVQRDLRLERDASAAVGKVLTDAVDRRFDFEDILPRLEQQQVRPTFRQTASLLVEEPRQLVKADIAEVGIVAGGQHAAGTHAASHEAGDAGFGLDLIAGGAGDASGGAVDFKRSFAQAMFGQGAAIAAEGIGFDGFGAGVQEGQVNLADDIGAGDDEIVDAVLIGCAAEIRGDERIGLDAGAHGAVEDDDMVGDSVEVAAVR